MTRCVIYLRVSTTEQSAENQLPVLQQLCSERDWRIVQVYSEEESAWRSGHQRELAKLRQDAMKRKFDVLLVWALDRLTREGVARIFATLDWFKAYGVQVISYQELYLTDVPEAIRDFFYAMIAWVAQFESGRRSERTKAGLERGRSQGKGRRGPDTKRRKRRWQKRPLK